MEKTTNTQPKILFLLLCTFCIGIVLYTRNAVKPSGKDNSEQVVVTDEATIRIVKNAVINWAENNRGGVMMDLPTWSSITENEDGKYEVVYGFRLIDANNGRTDYQRWKFAVSKYGELTVLGLVN